jgi:hypothetical protein
MSRLRVHCFSISLDGYGAGPRQTLKEPLGVGGEGLHGWMTGTRTFHKIFGRDGGGASVIRQYAEAGLVDELHIAVSPVLLGSGEPLFAGLDWAANGYRCTRHVMTTVAHYVLTRAG